MKVIGLTGGIGMGKSTSARLLRERGVPVVDTDLVAREVVLPGQPALAEIREVFGAAVIKADGTLDREALARRVFADSDARVRLEAILHPRIRAVWMAQVAAWRTEARRSAVVVIPLLFETKAEALCDVTICVACSAATQQQRLLARGWTPEHIRQRINAQWSVEVKLGLADHVVWTEGDLESHAEQLRRIIPGG
ncbi:MAG: dephospho-CoA kinase [Verrucomicrobia bacterium]|nr:dephospho-CoA kinase [Verrucomicrobiota bacterium]